MCSWGEFICGLIRSLLFLLTQYSFTTENSTQKENTKTDPRNFWVKVLTGIHFICQKCAQLIFENVFENVSNIYY